ncbi:23S rRNA (guanosine-2'-O-)-methyltransferase RlmB [Paenochrobactrum sp. BZR 201-1]
MRHALEGNKFISQLTCCSMTTSLPDHNIIYIDNADDERLLAYHAIKEKDLVGRDGLFIAEGKSVLNVALRSERFEILSLLILENRLSGMVQQMALCPTELPIYVVSSEIMDKIAGFHVHRGILAVGKQKQPSYHSQLIAQLPPEALVVVMCGLSNHDNVGSIFRNAAAFAADGILMDQTSCDPLYRKAIRVSVGAALKTPYARGGTIDEIIEALIAADFEILALSPSGAINMHQVPRVKRRALLLGTEGDGLPPYILQKLQTARIPMAEDFDSLNVATASGIALSQCSRFSQS